MPRPRRASHAHIEAEVRPEVLLAAAILMQAKKDLHARNASVRAEARTFWGNAAAVQFWSELLDVAPEHLQRAVGPG